MDYPSDSAVRLYNGKFTDGDPINNIPASKDPAAHQNALTDEILAVIIAAGLTPDEGDLTQLLQALQAGAGLSSGADWFELPGGWILQFGETGAVTSGSSILFPITFPTHCSVVLVCENQVGITNGANSFTNSDFVFVHDYGSPSNGLYIAIGK